MNIGEQPISAVEKLLQNQANAEKFGSIALVKNLQKARICWEYRQAHVCKQLQEIIGRNQEEWNWVN